ncbi:MAG: PhnD/SsuA/transferrin family substrate-binding protein [Gammaproteobacteria bacterium]|nr:PhnD/SsuA/transferrin family substrate-binding protein [Gammaproteobacteria bacterium]MCP5137326.1 PhnD/SsuA/transferrin family substrate-binding protein [Gammaproteobacteria bacterium]
MKTRLVVWGLVLPAALLASSSWAATLSLAVQPMLANACSSERYQGLVEYLSHRTGHQVMLVTQADSREFRQALKHGEFDLVVATDRYISSGGYQDHLVPLAVTESRRNYQLLIRADTNFSEPDDLIGHRIAGESAPSIASTTFVQMYTNPVRQPEYQAAPSVDASLNQLRNRSADAALVPQVADDCTRNFRVLANTPVKFLVQVGSARHVEPAVQEEIQQALLNVGRDMEGLRVLDETRFLGFSTLDSGAGSRTPHIFSMR